MKKPVLAVMFLITALLLASCAPGPNESAETGGGPAGFWKGLWHGFITLFTFVISVFTDKVNIYEVHNNGGWYNFGFLLGMAAFWGGGSGGACSGSKKR